MALWTATVAVSGLAVLRYPLFPEEPVRPQIDLTRREFIGVDPIAVGVVSTAPVEWTRSLFRPSRIVADGQTVDQQVLETQAEPRLPVLVGILFGEHHRIALMSHEGKLLRVRENESVGLWTLREIGRRSATVRKGNSVTILSLDIPLHSSSNEY